MTTEKDIWIGKVKECKTRLLSLGKKQKKIEHNLEESYKILTTPTEQFPKPPGLKGNLIDKDGFPRSDIDVHGVRIIRNERARTQTDYKHIMNEIEETLHCMHGYMEELKLLGVDVDRVLSSQAAGRPKTDAGDSDRRNDHEGTKHDSSISLEQNVEGLIPFAEVRSVASGSPSAEAGMRSGDLILSVGHIHGSNHRNLQAVGDLVRSSANRPLPLHVLRCDESHTDGRDEAKVTSVKRLLLTPKRWPGVGLLGCHIVPYESGGGGGAGK